MSEENSFIKIIPVGLLTHIFSFLSIDDLGRIVQVCSEWKKVANDSKLWRLIASRESKAISEKIIRLERGWYYTHYKHPGSSENRTVRCKQNLQAARQLNEILIEKGDPEAIQRKIEGLERGGDPVYTISSGHQFSSYGMEMEMRNARHPTYGYKKDKLELKKFLESIN